MATLSEDSSSWRAYGLVKKYQDWEKPPTPQERRKAKKTKDKRWCKGQEGTEHDFVYQARSHDPACYREYDNGRRRELRCYSHKHRSITECTRCHLDFAHLRGKARKAAIAHNPSLASEQEKLEEKWCQEGHLWDWVERVPNVRSPYYDWGFWRPYIQQCAMCGKGSGKYRKDLPQD